MVYILEEIEKDKEYLEVLKSVGEGVSRKDLGKLKRDNPIQKWMFIWDSMGLIQRGTKRVLVVDGC